LHFSNDENDDNYDDDEMGNERRLKMQDQLNAGPDKMSKDRHDTLSQSINQSINQFI